MTTRRHAGQASYLPPQEFCRIPAPPPAADLDMTMSPVDATITCPFCGEPI
jgi:hypothetical protein